MKKVNGNDEKVRETDEKTNGNDEKIRETDEKNKRERRKSP